MMTSLFIRIFIKDYRNTSNQKVRENYGKLAGAMGIATNLLLTLIKMVAGILFNSIAMTADAVNNLTDSASSVVTLVGFKLSSKPADKKHPYGHARIEYISGLIVSIVILVLGFELARTSLDKILNPEVTDFNWIAIGVLAVSILLKIWQCLFYRKMGKAIQSPTLKAASADSFNDVIATSVILLGGFVTRFTGFNLDGYLGMAVAIFIMISGVRLILETSNPLLGLSPSRNLVEKIQKKILSFDGILGFHDLKVHDYGESVCFASVHCELPADQDIMVSHDIIDRLERETLKELNVNLVVHMDPVVVNDERIDALRKQVGALLHAVSPQITMHDFRVVWEEEHTNLTFDINVPFQFPQSDQELEKNIIAAIAMLDPTYQTTLVIDHGEDMLVGAEEHKEPEEDNQ
jgi:cation diffusion facilitator family transporter